MTYAPAQDLLKDKTILVTGASDGIGRVAAKTYAAHGATVILLGRRTAALESVYDEIVEMGQAQPGIVVLDLATQDISELQQLGDVILERYGKLDGLLHNAAILGDRVPIETYDMNTWAKVMQVNFVNVCYLSRILIPLLRLAPTASAIFTSSGVGALPRAYWGAYSVSKYALEGFAKLLAEETENTSNIRVNILNPGGTRTKMRAAAFPNEDPDTLTTPQALMPLYLYLMGGDVNEHGQTFDRNWAGLST
ncbi:MAG: NAD(P)-dependent dehydrogenase (short-subunit alcohol dehydrogenase family) [Candidatus Azotimanducaceae bacterium]|jgi:NAD(P)-dependent dehydrogenase (short-subunit alcohol dehydrogenase family)